MRPTKAVVALLAAGFLLPASSVLAQFNGSFSGYYAPANWSVSVYNNPTYDTTAYVDSSGAPNTVSIVGAVDAEQQVSTPQLPVSIIDYSITLPGTGLETVQFDYTFTGVNDGYQGAALLYNGTVVGTSGSYDGSIQAYFNDTTFFGGGTLTFQVTSDNESTAPVLTIIAVPEPSAMALLGLGAAALAWNGRRNRSEKR